MTYVKYNQINLLMFAAINLFMFFHSFEARYVMLDIERIETMLSHIQNHKFYFLVFLVEHLLLAALSFLYLIWLNDKVATKRDVNLGLFLLILVSLFLIGFNILVVEFVGTIILPLLALLLLLLVGVFERKTES